LIKGDHVLKHQKKFIAFLILLIQISQTQLANGKGSNNSESSTNDTTGPHKSSSASSTGPHKSSSFSSTGPHRSSSTDSNPDSSSKIRKKPVSNDRIHLAELEEKLNQAKKASYAAYLLKEKVDADPSLPHRIESENAERIIKTYSEKQALREQELKKYDFELNQTKEKMKKAEIKASQFFILNSGKISAKKDATNFRNIFNEKSKQFALIQAEYKKQEESDEREKKKKLDSNFINRFQAGHADGQWSIAGRRVENIEKKIADEKERLRNLPKTHKSGFIEAGQAKENDICESNLLIRKVKGSWYCPKILQVHGDIKAGESEEGDLCSNMKPPETWGGLGLGLWHCP
jgi:hypothetical protein